MARGHIIHAYSVCTYVIMTLFAVFTNRMHEKCFLLHVMMIEDVLKLGKDVETFEGTVPVQ